MKLPADTHRALARKPERYLASLVAVDLYGQLSDLRLDRFEVEAVRGTIDVIRGYLRHRWTDRREDLEPLPRELWGA